MWVNSLEVIVLQNMWLGGVYQLRDPEGLPRQENVSRPSGSRALTNSPNVMSAVPACPWDRAATSLANSSDIHCSLGKRTVPAKYSDYYLLWMFVMYQKRDIWLNFGIRLLCFILKNFVTHAFAFFFFCGKERYDVAEVPLRGVRATWPSSVWRLGKRVPWWWNELTE